MNLMEVILKPVVQNLEMGLEHGLILKISKPSKDEDNRLNYCNRCSAYLGLPSV